MTEINLSKYDVGASVELFEKLGFSFSLDWDDEVTIDFPDEIDTEALANAIAQHPREIVIRLRRRAAMERHVFAGGPFSGKGHHCCHWDTGRIYAFKVRRAWWAAYEAVGQHDERLWFRGYATSESKARKKQFAGAPE